MNYPLPTVNCSPQELARQQLMFVRGYTLELLNDLDDSEWFTVPEGAVSHIAWQVGHLAMAEYGLTMLRVRDRQAEDEQIIAKDFIRCFKKGSQPLDAEVKYPSVPEIREVLGRVHQHALAAICGYSAELLNEPLPAPTAVYPNKLGSILFCPLHEMLHAGQIGTLRRQLGKTPLR